MAATTALSRDGRLWQDRGDFEMTLAKKRPPFSGSPFSFEVFGAWHRAVLKKP